MRVDGDDASAEPMRLMTSNHRFGGRPTLYLACIYKVEFAGQKFPQTRKNFR